jgi:hypothetical protein
MLTVANIQPFQSETHLLTYAKGFLDGHIKDFRKDLRVCMRADAEGNHAYFPALITCVGFFELLSGLHAGKLEWHGLPELEAYIQKFVRKKNDYQHIDILYNMFRHKIAHIRQPYLVFDTAKKSKLKPPRRRITWTVGIFAKKKAIELIDHEERKLIKSLTPWEVTYDARMKVSLTALRDDAIQSIRGPRGYFDFVCNDTEAQERFANCIKEYAPP